MTSDEFTLLQKQGANARAAGSYEFDCPFLKIENCPSATGESIEEWNAKVLDWIVELL